MKIHPFVCQNTKCGEHEKPARCLTEPDPEFTMDFSDIGEDPIYWCSACGPEAKAMDEAITSRFKVDSNFAEKFKRAIVSAEEKN